MCKAVLDSGKSFETRKLAESVCEHLDSKDYLSEYLALYYFLIQHTRYMRDPKRTELVRSPAVISKQILAGFRPSIDCDDMSTWLADAIMSVGGTADFTTVAFSNVLDYDGNQQYSHVFARAFEPRAKKFIVLDPVAAEKTSQMIGRIKFAKHWPIEG